MERLKEQGLFTPEKRLICKQQMQIYSEGGYRQDSARVSSERHKEDARGNSHDLKQGKFRTKQGAGLDTVSVPFHSRSFFDSWVFCFDGNKTKILSGKLQLLIEPWRPGLLTIQTGNEKISSRSC